VCDFFTTKLAASFGYEILPHAPYSPDLAPRGFLLFPRLRKQLHGKRFQDDDHVIPAVEDFLNSQNETF
jgi:histone-lysine N-methyltransferase SETMAR